VLASVRWAFAAKKEKIAADTAKTQKGEQFFS